MTKIERKSEGQRGADMGMARSKKRLITMAIGIRYTNTNQFPRIDFKLHGKTNQFDESNNNSNHNAIRHDQVVCG